MVLKVYVMEVGDYEQRGINGVYATLEAAKKARPDLEWEVGYGYDPATSPRRWWAAKGADNGCPWISEYEVERG